MNSSLRFFYTFLVGATISFPTADLKAEPELVDDRQVFILMDQSESGSPDATFNISLHGNVLRFAGSQVSEPLDLTAPGRVVAYRFHSGKTAEVAASGGMKAEIIGNLATNSQRLKDHLNANVWIRKGPGDFESEGTKDGGPWGVGDINDGTVSIDVSDLEIGKVVVFYGARTGNQSIDVDMIDKDGGKRDLNLFNVGFVPGKPGQTRWMATSFEFVNDGSYDTIEYRLNGNNGRFLGTVVLMPESLVGKAAGSKGGPSLKFLLLIGVGFLFVSGFLFLALFLLKKASANE